MRTRLHSSARYVLTSALLVGGSGATPAGNAAGPPPPQATPERAAIKMRSMVLRQGTPRQVLDRGHFLYNSDDVTDAAAEQYRLVVRQWPGTEEADTAQYHLGAYFQRKYYILRDRFGRDERKALDQAAAEFTTYIRRAGDPGQHRWFADAHFNLALAYLQLGDRQTPGAISRLAKAADRDAEVYVYQVVWSRRGNTVVDAAVPARPLAETMKELVGALGLQGFDQTTAKLTIWCQGQRRRVKS